MPKHKHGVIASQNFSPRNSTYPVFVINCAFFKFRYNRTMKSFLNKLLGQPRLLSLDDETSRAVARTGVRPLCNCFTSQHAKNSNWRELKFHYDQPKQECSAWMKLLDLIDRAESDGREVFEPGAELDWEEWIKITKLPTSIGKLKNVRSLLLYGSNIASIPPEIGGMSSLEKIDLYTSYRLHWLPYEITKCKRLMKSRISTRALYGNYKYRPPFPRLRPYIEGFEPNTCSVCNKPFDKFENHKPQQFWVSLMVATDVVPLLVHACSSECVKRLPAAYDGYIDRPHKGGVGQKQPNRRF